jgi:hypothetical protein
MVRVDLSPFSIPGYHFLGKLLVYRQVCVGGLQLLSGLVKNSIYRGA